LAAVDAYRSPRAFYEACAQRPLGGLPIINWRNDRCSASFYLRRMVPPARDETELDRLAPRGGWLLCQEQELEPLARPHRVVLRREQRDPFLPGRGRVWILAYLAAGDASAGESHGRP
jgi:hypothetical protein